MGWRPSGSLGTQKFPTEKSARKAIASIFWDCQWIFVIDFQDKGRAITGNLPIDVNDHSARKRYKEKTQKFFNKGVLFLQVGFPLNTNQFPCKQFVISGSNKTKIPLTNQI